MAKVPPIRAAAARTAASAKPVPSGVMPGPCGPFAGSLSHALTASESAGPESAISISIASPTSTLVTTTSRIEGDSRLSCGCTADSKARRMSGSIARRIDADSATMACS